MRGRSSLALAAALTAAVPVQAAPSRQFAADFRQLQAEDARLNAIGYRLITANAASCADVQPSAGLLLTDAAAYRKAGDARKLLGLSGDIAVQAVAPGSASAEAGLKAGDEVLAVAGRPVADSPAGGVERLNRLNDAIDAALLTKGRVAIGLVGRAVDLGGASACRARFELTTDGKGARAGSLMVQVSRAMLGEAQGEDEAAFVVAHELAHVVLGHSRPDRTAAEQRRDEREADRLAIWLVANAGYDPAASKSLLDRWGQRGLRALGDATHEAPSARVQQVIAEIGAMTPTAPGANGKRDWRPRFRPATPRP